VNVVRLTIEKVLVLKSVSVFARIPEEALVDVAAAVEEVEYPAGSVVVRKGEIGTSMYVVVHGRVRIHDEGKLLGEMTAGEVFGELSALDPKPRSATVTAVEDTELFKMGQDAIYELMAEHADLAQGIIRVLCQRIRNCDDLLRQMLPADRKVTAGQVGPPVPAVVQFETTRELVGAGTA
jgi:CRP/FNR family transcriptional regulator, cyclic AMP receptor protein